MRLSDGLNNELVRPVVTEEVGYHSGVVSNTRAPVSKLEPVSSVWTIEPAPKAAAFAVHDAKNLLAVISVNVHFLRSVLKQADNPAVQDTLDDIESCSNRLKDLLNEALEATRGEARRSGTVGLFQLSAVVRTAVEGMRRKAEQEGVSIQVRSTTDADAYIDRALVLRMLDNLLDNAIRYSPRSGKIEVCSMVRDNRLLLTVADEGPGVSEEQLEHIFEPFFTTEASPSNGGCNAGLGLTFCRTAARAHGGSVRVHNLQPHGACFVVDLPLGQSDESDCDVPT